MSFTVPKSLLVDSSEYFEAECCDEPTSADPKVIHLSAAEPEIFACYLMWLYRKKVAITSDFHPDDRGGAERVCGDLVKLWLLADRLRDQRCRNAIVDKLVGTLEDLPRPDEIPSFLSSLAMLVWPSTKAGSSLRCMVLDYTLSQIRADHVESQMEHLPPEFLKDILLKALRKLDSNNTETPTPAEAVQAQQCFYHDHHDQFDGCGYTEEMTISGMLAQSKSLVTYAIDTVFLKDPVQTLTF